MIAIPNMSKPKDCYECPIAKSYLDCLMEKKYTCPIGHADDCPLIEIDLVKCEECEWSNGECSVGERYQGGCTFGERRADDTDNK